MVTNWGIMEEVTGDVNVKVLHNNACGITQR